MTATAASPSANAVVLKKDGVLSGSNQPWRNRVDGLPSTMVPKHSNADSPSTLRLLRVAFPKVSAASVH